MCFGHPLKEAEGNKIWGRYVQVNESINQTMQMLLSLTDSESPTVISANLENSAVATGLEKVSFHSNRKES